MLLKKLIAEMYVHRALLKFGYEGVFKVLLRAMVGVNGCINDCL